MPKTRRNNRNRKATRRRLRGGNGNTTVYGKKYANIPEGSPESYGLYGTPNFEKYQAWWKAKQEANRRGSAPAKM